MTLTDALNRVSAEWDDVANAQIDRMERDGWCDEAIEIQRALFAEAKERRIKELCSWLLRDGETLQ